MTGENSSQIEGNQAGVCLVGENSGKNDFVSKAADGFLSEEAIVRKIMLKDMRDVLKHGVLVSRLASLTARSLGMPEDFINRIGVAGVLHDIGKLRLSKYLYERRKVALKAEEMKYVRLHSNYSYEIVKEEGYDEEIQAMVYHHHENYDGSGYPLNLIGTAIPMGARILRTCDVFAALVSSRSYREAFDMDMAMELMIDEVKNFDMGIFLAFQKTLYGESSQELKELIAHTNSVETDKKWIPYIENARIIPNEDGFTMDV